MQAAQTSVLTEPDLDREFEFCPLRHSVWIAENFDRATLETSEIPGISLNSSAELDCGERTTLDRSRRFVPFSPEGQCAVQL